MADAKWKLETSIERLGTKPEAAIEGPSLRAFSKYASKGAFDPDSEWERLAVAQHNGLPTRVLDWTTSPLIAAHFATAERDHASADGVIWCVNVATARELLLPPEMYDSLRVDKAWLYHVRLLDEAFPTLDLFDQMTASFGEIMVLWEPPSIDARIANQRGVLSVMNGPSKNHDDYLYQQSQAHPGVDLVYRIVIDHKAKSEIRDFLDQNNITERVLFPGLPGLCDWLKRYYGPAY
jgi:hypothetical protein